jgi:hypothetical protein
MLHPDVKSGKSCHFLVQTGWTIGLMLLSRAAGLLLTERYTERPFALRSDFQHGNPNVKRRFTLFWCSTVSLEPSNLLKFKAWVKFTVFLS